ncbi:MAG: T9SS type A sorting domain-containing protein [Methylotenera sp.]|nr:T9SS type A sorting domain-containing protein [Flavobacterium sp.]
MKKITTFLFLLITIPFYSQWTQQISNFSVSLNDVYCINENTVVVVGNDGVIMKTIDGGLNWIQKISGTNENLNKVQFVNEQIGFSVGQNGTLIKSTDGGESWTTISTGITSYLTGISCINENVFFIGAESGPIRKTIDGGLSFEVENLGNFGFKYNIQFLNEMVGYAICYDALYKTMDGGNSWYAIHDTVFSFFFLNEDVGFVNASAGFYKTIDGGDTYIYLANIPFVMDKLFATSENVVWGVNQDFIFNGPPDYTMRGEINNLGEFQQSLTNSPLLESIYFTNPTNGYAINDHGIYKNTSGLLNLNDRTLKSNIVVYPNPASDVITISFSQNNIQPFKIEIANCLGEIVLSKFEQTVNSKINVESLSKGVYFLTITIQEKKETRKVMIE